MGKVDDNKKLKMNTLLQTAFDLFTGKGFAKTTVSDIVNQAGLAKGTFYLYFKDKYDLRDKLIAHKACQLFDDAHKQLEGVEINSLEEEILFLTETAVLVKIFVKESLLGSFPGCCRNRFCSVQAIL